MSDAQKLIADVLAQHQEHIILGDYWVAKCSPACGWIGNQPYGFRNNAEEAHRGHVAAEIDKAIGGLTGEWGVVVAYPPRPADGYPGAVVTLDSYRLREAAESVKRTKYPEDDYEVRSRWVSGWEERVK